MKLDRCHLSAAITTAIFVAAIALAPDAEAKCDNCGTVTDVKTITKEGEGSGVGAVAGGVLGGVLGHQVGSGRGNTAATIVGAGAGAYAGNQVEKKPEDDDDLPGGREDGGRQVAHLQLLQGNELPHGRQDQGRRRQAHAPVAASGAARPGCAPPSVPGNGSRRFARVSIPHAKHSHAGPSRGPLRPRLHVARRGARRSRRRLPRRPSTRKTRSSAPTRSARRASTWCSFARGPDTPAITSC